MFSDKYKKDNEKINLENSFKSELANKMKGEVKMKKNNKRLRASMIAAATMVIIVGGCFFTQYGSKVETDEIVKVENEENRHLEGETLGENIGETSMASFLRYKGKDYRYVFHNIDSNKVNELKGEKLGTTITGSMDKEFSSHIEGMEIYTMKGYEDKSVLIGILTTDTDIIIDVFNHYDESEFKIGNDLISKMKIENNINKVEVINNMGEGGKVEDINSINLLLEELKKAENKLNDSKFMESFYGTYAGESKGINIQLNDGIIRTFDLYKTGFIFIDGYIFDLKNKEKAFEIYNKL
ncbi:MAG: hypothetical protein ACRCTZ_05195 [Sarcina sp.]